MNTPELPPLPANLPNIVRRIRACEGEIAAQVVFEHALNEYAIAAIQAQCVPDVDALTDKIAECLRGTYHCTRVWEAWNVGTMSEDDFEPVDESETPREIAEEIAAMLASTPPPAPQAKQCEWTNCPTRVGDKCCNEQAKPQPLSDDGDKRIAELEERNRDLHEDVQRFKAHALNEKAARLELERQLEEAMKGTP